MTAVTLMTELDAVNILLDCINESPVSNLEVSGLVDVAKARAVLTEVSREVQSRGWHWNTEEEYPLPLDSNGNIPLATNMVKVDCDRKWWGYDVVQRGLKLYWLTKHTYVFDKGLTGKVVFLLPWDELPQQVRHYITIRAARRFQARQFGSDTKHKFSESDEYSAAAALMGAELDVGDPNMLTDSPDVRDIVDR